MSECGCIIIAAKTPYQLEKCLGLLEFLGGEQTSGYFPRRAGMNPDQFVLPTLNWITAPTLDELTARSKLLKVKLGRANLGHRWFCHKCGTENQPSENLLLNLHPFACSKCKEQNPTAFSWSYVDLVVNNVELDFPILDQGDHPTCTANALVHGMDAKRRIYGGLLGITICQDIDAGDLLGKFSTRYGDFLGFERTRVQRANRIHCLMSIAQVEGIGYENASAMTPDIDTLPSLGRVLKIANCFQVKKSEPEHIVRLLAGGFPLLTGIPSGRCFQYVAAGKIYRPAKAAANHAVLLIGSGVAEWPGDEVAEQSAETFASWPVSSTGEKRPRTFYRARGSYGDKYHPDYENDGMGGDFGIWAEDIHDFLWGFNLTEDIP